MSTMPSTYVLSDLRFPRRTILVGLPFFVFSATLGTRNDDGKIVFLAQFITQFPDVVIGLFAVVIFVVFDVVSSAKGASRTQEVEIFFNFVGKVEIPHEEIVLTEEEKAALAEQERRRAKKAEYNRRYMEKKRRQWREQREREQEQKPHKLPPVADEKGEKSA